MNYNELFELCSKFRKIIECIRDEGGFYSKNANKDRMSNFPLDCCDDTTDLLGYYLLHDYKEHIYTQRITMVFEDSTGFNRYHSVLLFDDKTLVDLTGDQFIDRDIPPVYIGNGEDYYEDMNFFERVDHCDFVGIDNARLSHDYDAILEKLKTYI